MIDRRALEILVGLTPRVGSIPTLGTFLHRICLVAFITTGILNFHSLQSSELSISSAMK